MVGVVLCKEVGMIVKGFAELNGRIILVKPETKPTHAVILQVCIPTSAEDDHEIDTEHSTSRRNGE